jgi:hypothetical protein
MHVQDQATDGSYNAPPVPANSDVAVEIANRRKSSQCLVHRFDGLPLNRFYRDLRVLSSMTYSRYFIEIRARRSNCCIRPVLPPKMVLQ